MSESVKPKFPKWVELMMKDLKIKRDENFEIRSDTPVDYAQPAYFESPLHRRVEHTGEIFISIKGRREPG